jgi:formylglycine-generating enzyme required for sulfatase activity
MKKKYKKFYRDYPEGSSIKSHSFSGMMRVMLFACLLIFTSYSAYANNVTVSGVFITEQNSDNHYSKVQFIISWENSWRTSSADPYNWDAAWVFIKYRVNPASGGDGLWRHATINTTGSVAPTGSTISVPSDGVGAFIYRSTDGTGTFTVTGAQLQWNYGLNYKNSTDLIGDNDIVDIKIFAIEMVYVSQGSFYVGDGGNSGVCGRFNRQNATTPFQITDETVPATLGGALAITANLHNNNALGMDAPDDFNNSTTQSLAEAFPKGYNAFYCMKHEIIQQQYVDFLNMLTYTQQATRTPIAPNSAAGTYFFNQYRHKIKISTPGVESTTSAVYTSDYLYVSCEYMSWADMAAYLDWSGLRPMTELEFEKSCRGPLTKVTYEYAWGSQDYSTVSGISNSGAINEIASNSGANICSSVTGSMGTMRAGCFAKSSTTNRYSSGATYYGILDMSGNTNERCITVGSSTGRAFTGTHGNGILNTSGSADVLNWPTGYVGVGVRGGSWLDSHSSSGDSYLEISNRSKAVAYTNVADNRYAGYGGGRGVRTAP